MGVWASPSRAVGERKKREGNSELMDALTELLIRDGREGVWVAY